MTDETAKNAAEVAKAVKAKVSSVAADAGPSAVRRSLSIANLAGAMVKAQTELKNPPKDSVNPHFKSKYADLATVRDAVIPVFVKHGLAVMQLPCEMDDAPALTTLVTHTSGEWLETTIKLRPGKMDPQGVGSALTYARRYALQSVAGVAAEDDDDGNAASRPAQQQTQARPTPAPKSGVMPTPWARGIIAKLDAAITRDVGLELYREFDAEAKAGKVTDADRAALDRAFREFGERFPKPARV
jgi:hypothetical protein